jgi:hypothetical protein
MKIHIMEESINPVVYLGTITKEEWLELGYQTTNYGSPNCKLHELGEEIPIECSKFNSKDFIWFVPKDMFCKFQIMLELRKEVEK